MNLKALLDEELIWFPRLGYGVCPAGADRRIYDVEYHGNYVCLDRDEISDPLTNFRIKFVRQYWDGPVLDFGVGSGKFLGNIGPGSTGFDVLERSVKMLVGAGLYEDPYSNEVQAMTCWDSLEHVDSIEQTVHNVREWLFVTMPIYANAEEVITSKHYKPGEHVWYFTARGFIMYMKRLGFICQELDTSENEIGRVGVMSFAFRRRNAAAD